MRRKRTNEGVFWFFRSRISPHIFVFENIFRTSNFVNMFTRNSNGMKMKSHSSYCKFDFNEI